ncbi:MAG TPA: hypothetical protein VE397_15490, partial [Stellaceae bacterium]|nr:hypothetical protein [Stellaceae bacterium]
MRARAPFAALALALLLLAPAARAQNSHGNKSSTNSSGNNSNGFGLGLTSNDDNGKPIEIEADDGIEWQQNNRVYIARGNAKATRGQTTVFADTLTAFYRPVCSPEARAAAAKRAAREAALAAQTPANAA